LCRKNRIDNEDRCSEDIWKRRGKPEGACGDEIGELRRIIVQALGDYTFAQKAGTRSPAYEAIKNLRISDLSIDAMLRSWLSRDLDTYGFDPREAVCAWAADNIDEITQAIPRGYPREVLENEWYESGELLPHQTPHDTAPDFILGEVSPLPDSTGNGEDDQG
jgi:hypothetical protein